MEIIRPEMSLGDARALFFKRSGFPPDGGYGERWVKLRLWRFPIWFPNTKGRRRAVKFHDLHHILAGYPTTWRGETEISAWEIATGLRRNYEGWLLDLLGLAMGLVINPRGVYRAFLRGRRSTNLYGMNWDEEILSQRVGEMRQRLGLDGERMQATLRDKLSFVAWSFLSALTYVGTGAILLFPLALALFVIVWMRGWL